MHEAIYICQSCRKIYGYSAFEYRGVFLARDQILSKKWQAEESSAFLYYEECPACGGIVQYADKQFPLPHEFEPTILRALLTFLLSWAIFAVSALVPWLLSGRFSSAVLLPLAWWGAAGACLILISMLPGILARHANRIVPVSAVSNLPIRLLGTVMPMTQIQKWIFLLLIPASAILGLFLYQDGSFQPAGDFKLIQQGWVNWLVGAGIGLLASWAAYAVMLAVNSRRKVVVRQVNLPYDMQLAILSFCDREANQCLYCVSPSDYRVHGTPDWRTIQQTRVDGELLILQIEGVCERNHITSARVVVDSRCGEVVDVHQWGPTHQGNKKTLRRTWSRIQRDFGIWTTLKYLPGADLKDTLLVNLNLSKFFLKKVDLRRANLSHAILTKANLENANMEYADLSQASADAVILRKANLKGAFLHQTRLVKADLTEAKFFEADLSGADLSQADASYADFGGAVMNKTILKQSILKRANLSAAKLQEADLRSANLVQSTLDVADLTQADLSFARLYDASLNESELMMAKLCNADLGLATLTKADLCGADLSHTNLIGTDLNEADLDETDLSDAKLAGTNLSGAKHMTQKQFAMLSMLLDTVMPDGKTYDPKVHTEIARLRSESGKDKDDSPG